MPPPLPRGNKIISRQLSVKKSSPSHESNGEHQKDTKNLNGENCNLHNCENLENWD